MLPGARKSVEPTAARIDPRHASARHQALHHFVAKARWSDAEMLRWVAQWVVPRMGFSAGGCWIIDDTAFPKKGTPPCLQAGSSALYLQEDSALEARVAMVQRLAIRGVGHHREEVLAARVADQQALVPVLADIADEGSVDLPFSRHLGTAHITDRFHECRLAPAVGLRTRTRRVGRPFGVVRPIAELQKIEHHHRAVGARITQRAHLIGRGVDGRIENGGTEGHGFGPFRCRAVHARTALSARAGS